VNCPECVVAWIIWTDNATSCQANFPTRESATLGPTFGPETRSPRMPDVLLESVGFQPPLCRCMMLSEVMEAPD